ncbi:hypothetical protein RRU01S_22_00220 [Agrobacterium rubi TR3 = NBRC 13261]|uniref:Uncharacterized protein n=1 Tax=Agrobacterium rubi TR3 = NBRC 13261 TaxID=1368415 RepID=A0A081CYZ3_9HYPH|nr:hypothetical protein [Agrobacterium rubi]GAK71889.1 hypothetical protein RRU01S_22_00220 [Agrobacterium rubi TR3 = NBRC 13261]
MCREPALGTVSAARAARSIGCPRRVPVPDPLFTVLDEGFNATDELDLQDLTSLRRAAAAALLLQPVNLMRNLFRDNDE